MGGATLGRDETDGWQRLDVRLFARERADQPAHARLDTACAAPSGV